MVTELIRQQALSLGLGEDVIALYKDEAALAERCAIARKPVFLLSDQDVEFLMAEMVATGEFKRNKDGSFSMTEKGRNAAQGLLAREGH